MKAACLLVTLLGVLTATAALATDLGLIAGQPHGTYDHVGQDLKRLAKAGGINLTVHPSKGSLDNIAAVHLRPDIQLGIVQSDVLAFVGEQRTRGGLGDIANNVRLVFPLYDEQIHVVGRRDIGGLEQLAGKRVAIGAEGTGSYLTGRMLLKLGGVVPGDLVLLDAREALAALKAGRVDAMIHVASAPIGLLKDGITERDGLALIGISHRNVLETYAPAEIPANLYAWQPTPVSTVAVKALLVASSRGTCDTVGRFAQVVADGMDWLVRNGHPKWREVDLAHPIQGWEQYDCVRRYLGKAPANGDAPSASPPPRPNPVSEAIKDVLDAR
jgi:TRAP transporter TAXI family solute receptor